LVKIYSNIQSTSSIGDSSFLTKLQQVAQHPFSSNISSY